MSSQSQFQGRENRSPLLTKRGKIAANAEKRFSTRQTTETTRNFLLDFDHANIALCLRVVKRNVKAFQEAQHRILVLGESVEQIAGRTLFARPPLLALSGGGATAGLA